MQHFPSLFLFSDLSTLTPVVSSLVTHELKESAQSDDGKITLTSTELLLVLLWLVTKEAFLLHNSFSKDLLSEDPAATLYVKGMPSRLKTYNATDK